jgi:hypothetical protein
MVLRDTYDDIDDYFSLFCYGLYSIVSWNESNVWTCYTMTGQRLGQNNYQNYSFKFMAFLS